MDRGKTGPLMSLLSIRRAKGRKGWDLGDSDTEKENTTQHEKEKEKKENEVTDFVGNAFFKCY